MSTSEGMGLAEVMHEGGWEEEAGQLESSRRRHWASARGIGEGRKVIKEMEENKIKI